MQGTGFCLPLLRRCEIPGMFPMFLVSAIII